MATDWVPKYMKDMMNRTGNSKFEIPKMPIPDLAKGNVGTDHEGNWTWRHLDNTQHSWRTDPDELKQVPVNTEPVTSDNPLVVDIYDSVRSPAESLFSLKPIYTTLPGTKLTFLQ